MSEAFNPLQSANKVLLDQLNQLKATNDSLINQLEASKQMFTEAQNSAYMMRIQGITCTKQNADLVNQVNQLKAQVEKLSNPQASDVAPDPQV